MSVLGRLLSRLIVIRFLISLFVLSFFVISLDILANLDALLVKTKGNAFALAHYALLLAPETLNTFYLVSILLGVLLTLSELSSRHELPAIWACGLSPFGVVRLLFPLAVVLGVGYFLLQDQVIPRVSPALQVWNVGERALKSAGEKGQAMTWMRSKNDIVRLETVSADGRTLGNVMIVKRTPSGALKTVLLAKKAQREERGWRLFSVMRYELSPLTSQYQTDLLYDGELVPAFKGPRSGDPKGMTLSTVLDFIAHGGYGIRPVYLYQTWWHKRLSTLVTPFLLMALCLPLATRFQRGGAAGRLLVWGIGLGFVFSIFDGISLSMGEIGVASPVLAGWIPVVIYILLWGGMSMRYDSV